MRELKGHVPSKGKRVNNKMGWSFPLVQIVVPFLLPWCQVNVRCRCPGRTSFLLASGLLHPLSFLPLIQPWEETSSIFWSGKDPRFDLSSRKDGNAFLLFSCLSFYQRGLWLLFAVKERKPSGSLKPRVQELWAIHWASLLCWEGPTGQPMDNLHQ